MPGARRMVCSPASSSTESEIYQEKASQAGGWQGSRPFLIKEKRLESELITSFLLAPVDGKPVLDFKPGQYLSIKLVHPELEYQEIRQYSSPMPPTASTTASASNASRRARFPTCCTIICKRVTRLRSCPHRRFLPESRWPYPGGAAL